MSNNIKEFLLKECIQILDRKDVKDEFKKMIDKMMEDSDDLVIEAFKVFDKD